MLYNFLDPKLLPKVSSESPATDEYEPTNLLSPNFLVKSRGFMAYTTIKPPVDLIFELICSVNIHYIKIVPTVGNQKCTGIEIETKTPASGTGFQSIAKLFFDTSVSVVIFRNSRIDLPQSLSDTTSHRFNRHAFRSFTNASFVKIRILRTQKSVPCIGSIEIWGNPSKLCSPTTISTIGQLFNKTPTSSTSAIESETCSDEVEDLIVPDDFKDALTFEIMSLPMTLPSGSTIDKSTLERYVESEATYGRYPSDPFTGVRFSDKCKPIFNASLKGRIDMFLLDNSEKVETFKMHRTVGTKQTHSVASKSGSQTLNTCSVRAWSSVEVEPKTKRFKSSSDLDDDIRQVMSSSGFIRFTAANQSIELSNGNNHCIVCDDCNVSNLYILMCKHLYCRKCVTDACNKRPECQSCKKMFSKSDVKKFHVP